MVRSMYSGVAGMRTHQTSLDVIGNNIANVNTYGFKSSRTTFRDIYYQSMRGASSATGTRGGVNASQVGVGTQVGSIDVMQTRSSFTQTDMTMDVAIDGEGFVQVMDGNGNKFYTRAGQLNFDSFGNLVDSKGNFVLGVNGDPFGKGPSSDKIQVQLGAVDPTAAEITEIVNNKEFTIETTEPSRAGNVGVQFMSTTLPVGQDMVAEVTESGIIVKVSKTTEFTSLDDFSTKMDTAIQEASRQLLGENGHPAGTFSVSSPDVAAMDWPLTGEDITSASYGVKLGSITAPDLPSGYSVKAVGSEFSANTNDAAANLTFTVTGAAGTDHIITLNINGTNYTGTLPGSMEGSGTILLKNGGSSTDYVELAFPKAESVEGENYDTVTGRYPAAVNAAANTDLTAIRTAVNSLKSYVTQAETHPSAIPAADLDARRTAVDDALNALIAAQDDTAKTDAKNALATAMTALAGGVTGITTNLLNVTSNPTATAAPNKGVISVPSAPSKSLGFSSKTFLLAGGTEGGPQGIESLSGISIGTDGVIIGFHDTLGDESGRVYLGRIDVATFSNPQGLTEAGSTYFTASANSGTMTVSKAGEDGAGQIVSGSLELSNVDLAKEFTEMIKTQRGYQANSRIITVTDTMLEELINLKR